MDIETFCKPLNEAGVKTCLTTKHNCSDLTLEISIADAYRCGAEAYEHVDNCWRFRNKAGNQVFAEKTTLDLTFIARGHAGEIFIRERAFGRDIGHEQFVATQQIILEHHKAAQEYQKGVAGTIAKLFSEKMGVPVTVVFGHELLQRSFVIDAGKFSQTKSIMAANEINKKFYAATISVKAQKADDQFWDKKCQLWLTFPLLQHTAVKEGLEKVAPDALNCREIMEEARKGWFKRAWATYKWALQLPPI